MSLEEKILEVERVNWIFNNPIFKSWSGLKWKQGCTKCCFKAEIADVGSVPIMNKLYTITGY